MVLVKFRGNLLVNTNVQVMIVIYNKLHSVRKWILVLKEVF